LSRLPHELSSKSAHRVSIYHLFSLFTKTVTTEIYTLSLHDALPICADVRLQARGVRRLGHVHRARRRGVRAVVRRPRPDLPVLQDRKSTRLNSSHVKISYAVFCLKKKNK